jgi:hypothetical protein
MFVDNFLSRTPLNIIYSWEFTRSLDFDLYLFRNEERRNQWAKWVRGLNSASSSSPTARQVYLLCRYLTLAPVAYAIINSVMTSEMNCAVSIYGSLTR